MFYPFFRVLPFFPRFTPFSAFYPFFRVLPLFPRFTLFSAFYPFFRVLPFFPRFTLFSASAIPPFRFRVLPLPVFHTRPYEINNFAIICPSFNSFLNKFTNYLKILLSTIQYCEFSRVKTFTGYSSAVSFNASPISLHTKCGCFCIIQTYFFQIF